MHAATRQGLIRSLFVHIRSYFVLRQLGGIELMHMIKKGQMKGTGQTAAEQFYSLAK
jgi:hypothetical protein